MVQSGSHSSGGSYQNRQNQNKCSKIQTHPLENRAVVVGVATMRLPDIQHAKCMENLSHTAGVCFFHFNKEINNPKQTHYRVESNYTPNQGQYTNPTALVANSSVANPEVVANLNWYADSGALNHITAYQNSLNSPVDYAGNERIIVGNGPQLPISRLGTSNLVFKNDYLKLNDVLCVPTIAKNLFSVPKLARDNNVHVEFHPEFCVVKDQVSGEILLKVVP